MNKYSANENKIIFPKLSYKIKGVLFDVHSQLGNRYQEKYYSRAVALGFEKVGLKFDGELKVNIAYYGKIIGKYYLDFLVEDKIVVELKAVPQLSPQGFKQISGYLKAKKLELGLLVNFRSPSLEYNRVLNSEFINKDYSNKFVTNSDKLGYRCIN